MVGLGHTPDECKVFLGGLPESIESLPDSELYMRLCELEALRVSLCEEQWRVFKELKDRGFFVETSVSCDQGMSDPET